ncbi:MAG: hypothetical protein GX053_08445 [Tissierella sp.]|nr:hypothetical protein [Tissierella sp.]
MSHSSVSPIYLDNKWVESKLLEAEGYTTELSPIGDGLFNVNIYPAGSAAGTLDDFLTFAKACLAILLLLVNILFVANIMSSMKGTIEVVRLHVMASIVLGLIPFIYALLLYKRWNRLRITNKQRISYFITMCTGFIMTLTVIILEMYKM